MGVDRANPVCRGGTNREGRGPIYLQDLSHRLPGHTNARRSNPTGLAQAKRKECLRSCAEKYGFHKPWVLGRLRTNSKRQRVKKREVLGSRGFKQTEGKNLVGTL